MMKSKLEWFQGRQIRSSYVPGIDQKSGVSITSEGYGSWAGL